MSKTTDSKQSSPAPAPKGLSGLLKRLANDLALLLGGKK